MTGLYPNAPSGTPIQIDVFGCCGEYQSGKTLLGLTIAPGKFPEGHPFAGQARTLCLDFEKSSCTYTGTGAEIVDVHTEMMATKPNYSAADIFVWFRAKIESMPAHRYDVIMADTISDIETGMVDYMRANITKHGLTTAQMAKSEGLFWGKVKNEWKLLLLKIASKCQTFYFTAHMRAQYQGNSPTRVREPKGKETLMELSSLYLKVDRSPDRKTHKVPDAPRAILLKNRLADTMIDQSGNVIITPLLPPSLDVCTIRTLCGFIEKGVNYSGSSKNLIVEPEDFTEVERMQLQLEIEEAKRITAVTELELEEKRQARSSRRDMLVANAQTPAPEPSPSVSTTEEKRAEPAETSSKDVPFEVPFCPDEPISDAERLAGDWLELLREKSKNRMMNLKIRSGLKQLGKTSINELTTDEAKELHDVVT